MTEESNPSDTPQVFKHWILDQTNRDGRQLYLQEYATSVEPDLQRAQGSVKHSVTYGSIGIQAAFVLNGGALGVLPLLIKAGPTAVDGAAVLFILGIATAGVATLTSYLNFQYHAQISWIDAADSADRVRKAYAPKPEEIVVPDRSKDRQKYDRYINRTLYVGIAGAVISYLCFISGALAFIRLAS